MKPAGEQAGGFRPYIVVGDRTSKGGVVFTGSPNVKWGPSGLAVARVGDKATCKCNQCKSRGYTVIVSGTPTFKADGQYVARDGDTTDCGAVLMDTGGAHFTEAMPMSVDLSFASAEGDGSRIGFALSSESASTQVAQDFDQHFLVKDKKTDLPVAGMPYRLTLPNGQEVNGMTDVNGYTLKIAAESALTAKLEVPYYGNSTSALDTEDGHSACGC